jgi:hypothetical protein
MTNEATDGKTAPMEIPPTWSASGVPLDDLLAELTGTPIGRRWLLKMGGFGAAALALQQAMPAFADGNQSAPKSRPARPPRRIPEAGHDVRPVFLALGQLPAFQDLVLRVGPTDHPLTAVSSLDQRLLAGRGKLFELVDRRRVSHVALNVSLPRTGPTDLIVIGRRPGSSKQGIVAQRVYAPRWAAVAVAQRGITRAGSVAAYVRNAGWIKTLGIPSSALNSQTAADLAELDVILESTSTAMAFVYKHPEIMNLDAEASATTNSVLAALPEVQAFGAAIDQIAQTDYPYTFEPVSNPDGSQAYFMDTSGDTPTPMLDPDTGDPAPAQKLVLNSQLTTPPGDSPFGQALKASINAIKDTTDLEGSTWDLTTTPAPAPQVQSTLLKATPPLNVALSRQGFNWGMQVQADAIDPSTRQIPLRIYNNWQRCLAVHVQYFADKDTQLPVDNHDQFDTGAANFRSTANSEYLTFVGDMPTIYGIPWNKNSNFSSTTITLPQDATFARLLVCGPGAPGGRADWRQFFSNDNYGDKSFPQECQWPLISTYLFDIGVPAILMAANAAVADGTAASSLKTAVNYTLMASKSATQNAMDGWQKLGGPLNDYFQNRLKQQQSGQDTSFQDVCVLMADLLPKVIWGIDANFDVYWRAGVVLTAIIVEYAIVKMIPVLGQVFAAIGALGNLAQIITTSIEMAASPWVLDTDIRITYAATVTISKDDRDSVWPRGAGGATWSLSILNDGASTSDPITGSIRDGQSDPVVIRPPAVALSRTIQYTLSVTDGTGNLIGQGKSSVLSNNDLNSLPTSVAFAIEEIQKPITIRTTFVRQNTLVFDSVNAGYSWARNVSVPTTVTNKPADFLELDSISVGTVSGMEGAIWRSNDANKSFWVRNVPTVQNGNTIKVQFAGPYTRRPLIVYDRLNADPVNGNNFLLEPSGDVGYLVRKLKLSANGGALSWTANQAWGQFTQNLAAVTLHPKNYLVGVNSISGKLHKLTIPSSPSADSDFPLLSQAHAGPAAAGSTRPGLTQTPVGVAVTLTGVVVVLEAGANRLQAFDVDGNSVAYFGTPPSSYFLQLAGSPSDTRLALGVDGAGWFYVLSYTGSGSSSSNYLVDIYQPNGTWVVTAHGVNAATFDVDYWRNLFTMDYAAVTSTAGGTYTDPALARIQPSSSIWIPSNPA